MLLSEIRPNNIHDEETYFISSPDSVVLAGGLSAGSRARCGRQTVESLVCTAGGEVDRRAARRQRPVGGDGFWRQCLTNASSSTRTRSGKVIRMITSAKVRAITSPKSASFCSTEKSRKLETLVRNTFLSDPVRQKAYQPFGDLHLHFVGQGKVTDYRRELDLDSAIASDDLSSRRRDRFERDVFASYPDQAIVMRITADQAGTSQLHARRWTVRTRIRRRTLSRDTNTPCADAARSKTNGLRFESRVRVVCDGGTVTTNGNVIVGRERQFRHAVSGRRDQFQKFSGHQRRSCRTLREGSGSRQSAQFCRRVCAIISLIIGICFGRVSLNLGPTCHRCQRTTRPICRPTNGCRRIKADGLGSDPAIGRAVFSIRPLSAHCQQPSRRPTGQSARPLERGTRIRRGKANGR